MTEKLNMVSKSRVFTEQKADRTKQAGHHLRTWGKIVKFIGPPVVLLTIMLVLWQALVDILEVNPMILPTPDRIVMAGIKDRISIRKAVGISLRETLSGLAVGLVSALVIAVLIDAFDILRRSIYPLLVSAQTIPVVAIAPLLVIWFGFGLFPKVLLVAIYTSFPMIVSLTGGMDATPKHSVDIMRTLGYGKWKIILTVKLPSALPQFFSGVRVAASYALGTAIIGEFLGAANGIGVYMTAAKSSFRTDLVFAASFVTVLLTLILYGSVIVIEKLALPWVSKGGEKENE